MINRFYEKKFSISPKINKGMNMEGSISNLDMDYVSSTMTSRC